MGPKQILPIWVWVNLGVMVMKGFSTFPKAIESYHQMVECHVQDTHLVGLLLIYRHTVGVFYCSNWLDGDYTGLQGFYYWGWKCIRDRTVNAGYKSIVQKVPSKSGCYWLIAFNHIYLPLRSIRIWHKVNF